jgi:hypothetical protein
VRLSRRRLPRLQMSVIVVITGLAGFLFSFALLNAGVSSMGLRYPCAATLTYGSFSLSYGSGWYLSDVEPSPSSMSILSTFSISSFNYLKRSKPVTDEFSKSEYEMLLRVLEPAN